MQAVTATIMRELDRRTIEFGTPGAELMERAGLGLAKHIEQFISDSRPARNRHILMIAGRGNNGGDVFAAAYHLHLRGMTPDVRLTTPAAEIKGDAKIHFDRMRSDGISALEFTSPDAWSNMRVSPPPMVIVDGILGTGITGAPREPAASAIEFINRCQHLCKIAAVDIPSGLNADDGSVAGSAVHADITITMGLPKTGLLVPAALDFVGNLTVVDIGIPAAFIPTPDGSPELIAPGDIAFLGRRRSRGAHKGGFGHLLIIAGARGYAGAAIMAAMAASRSGVGLITILAPRGIRAEISAAVPEVMTIAADENAAGSIAGLDSALQTDLQCHPNKFTTVLAGPGLTACADTCRTVESLLKIFSGPIVLDADALNVMAGRLAQMTAMRGSRTGNPEQQALLITPHPGEMARLMRITTDAVQNNRITIAGEAAAALQGVVVLKGAGTIVVAPGQAPRINLTGNPGMATGGSGDVLAGLLAGLVAQKAFLPCAAAQAAVYLHGRAGDMAAECITEPGLRAGDIIKFLPAAWRELVSR